MSRHKAKQTYSKRRIVNDPETYIQHNWKIYAFASIIKVSIKNDQATSRPYILSA